MDVFSESAETHGYLYTNAALAAGLPAFGGHPPGPSTQAMLTPAVGRKYLPGEILFNGRL